MNSTEDRSPLLQRHKPQRADLGQGKTSHESALQVAITQIAILKPREELAGVTKMRQ